MDAKDLRIETSLGDRSSNDGSRKFAQSGPALPCTTNMSENISSNPLGKVETPTSRPCAVIGPDRIVQPNGDAYLKKSHYEPWPHMDNAYRPPPEYPHKIPSYQSPIGNISPRLTFQENMQRIMVQPTYNSSKVTEDGSFALDRNLSKNPKVNGPTEPKYCDVPYPVNPMSSDQKSTETCVSNLNNPRNYPHMWHPGGVNMRPTKPYNAPDMYQFPEYVNCPAPRTMPITRPHRAANEDSSQIYNEYYYHEGNIRFKPYPTVKDRYPQARYEYVNNYANPFHPPHPYPPYKYDMQKTLQPHPTHSQVPIKYVDNRLADPGFDSYQRPQQGPYNVPYRNQVVHPTYGPMLGNNLPNKMYPYPPEGSIKPVGSNKPPYDNKLYVDYDAARNKGYPGADNYYVNDIRSHMKNPVIIPNYPASNMQPIHPHPYYRKENPAAKNFEYLSHLRHMDPSVNPNALTRLASQFSPGSIAISPSDSNTSNDTSQTQGGLEDCGYVSQSSTNSIRSVDSGASRMPHDFYRRYHYGYLPPFRTSPMTSKPEMSSNASKEKGNIDVRQFLQMWNEGEDENGGHPKEVKSQTDYNMLNKQSSQYEAAKSREQLYVLGLVNVPSEELAKYEHIQKVSKLPDNIKGYNNIELLKHFEEAIESSNKINPNQKLSNSRNYNVISKNTLLQALPPRPLSPLDVEAKISQSVIHKEVGCNFEIKPCSPEMLNVEVATPAQNILGERIIEKVTNPLVTNPPILSGTGEEDTMCDVMKQKDNPMISHENVKKPSCKMILNTTECLNHDTSSEVKPNNYTLHDLESNVGVCFASLPRLDNDIELNFPEVNQQFINANKESVIMTNDLAAARKAIQNDFESNAAEPIESESKNKVLVTSDSEKEISKLSKYRKIKRNDMMSIEKQIEINSQSLRTDSVIVKNLENNKSVDYTESNSSNIKKIEAEPLTDTATDDSPSFKIGENKNNEKDLLDDIAIDFSLNKIHNKSPRHLTSKSSEIGDFSRMFCNEQSSEESNKDYEPKLDTISGELASNSSDGLSVVNIPKENIAEDILSLECPDSIEPVVPVVVPVEKEINTGVCSLTKEYKIRGSAAHSEDVVSSGDMNEIGAVSNNSSNNDIIDVGKTKVSDINAAATNKILLIRPQFTPLNTVNELIYDKNQLMKNYSRVSKLRKELFSPWIQKLITRNQGKCKSVITTESQKLENDIFANISETNKNSSDMDTASFNSNYSGLGKYNDKKLKTETKDSSDQFTDFNIQKPIVDYTDEPVDLNIICQSPGINKDGSDSDFDTTERVGEYIDRKEAVKSPYLISLQTNADGSSSDSDISETFNQYFDEKEEANKSPHNESSYMLSLKINKDSSGSNLDISDMVDKCVDSEEALKSPQMISPAIKEDRSDLDIADRIDKLVDMEKTNKSPNVLAPEMNKDNSGSDLGISERVDQCVGIEEAIKSPNRLAPEINEDRSGLDLDISETVDKVVDMEVTIKSPNVLAPEINKGRSDSDLDIADRIDKLVDMENTNKSPNVLAPEMNKDNSGSDLGISERVDQCVGIEEAIKSPNLLAPEINEDRSGLDLDISETVDKVVDMEVTIKSPNVLAPEINKGRSDSDLDIADRIDKLVDMEKTNKSPNVLAPEMNKDNSGSDLGISERVDQCVGIEEAIKSPFLLSPKINKDKSGSDSDIPERVDVGVVMDVLAPEINKDGSDSDISERVQKVIDMDENIKSPNALASEMNEDSSGLDLDISEAVDEVVDMEETIKSPNVLAPIINKDRSDSDLDISEKIDKVVHMGETIESPNLRAPEINKDSSYSDLDISEGIDKVVDVKESIKSPNVPSSEINEEKSSSILDISKRVDHYNDWEEAVKSTYVLAPQINKNRSESDLDISERVDKYIDRQESIKSPYLLSPEINADRLGSEFDVSERIDKFLNGEFEEVIMSDSHDRSPDKIKNVLDIDSEYVGVVEDISTHPNINCSYTPPTEIMNGNNVPVGLDIDCYAVRSPNSNEILADLEVDKKDRQTNNEDELSEMYNKINESADIIDSSDVFISKSLLKEDVTRDRSNSCFSQAVSKDVQVPGVSHELVTDTLESPNVLDVVRSQNVSGSDNWSGVNKCKNENSLIDFNNDKSAKLDKVSSEKGLTQIMQDAIKSSDLDVDVLTVKSRDEKELGLQLNSPKRVIKHIEEQPLAKTTNHQVNISKIGSPNISKDSSDFTGIIIKNDLNKSLNPNSAIMQSPSYEQASSPSNVRKCDDVDLLTKKIAVGNKPVELNIRSAKVQSSDLSEENISIIIPEKCHGRNVEIDMENEPAEIYMNLSSIRSPNVSKDFTKFDHSKNALKNNDEEFTEIINDENKSAEIEMENELISNTSGTINERHGVDYPNEIINDKCKLANPNLKSPVGNGNGEEPTNTNNILNKSTDLIINAVGFESRSLTFVDSICKDNTKSKSAELITYSYNVKSDSDGPKNNQNITDECLTHILHDDTQPANLNIHVGKGNSQGVSEIDTTNSVTRSNSELLTEITYVDSKQPHHKETLVENSNNDTAEKNTSNLVASRHDYDNVNKDMTDNTPDVHMATTVSSIFETGTFEEYIANAESGFRDSSNFDCEEDSIEKTLNEIHADSRLPNIELDKEEPFTKRCLKRSYSDSALDMFDSDIQTHFTQEHSRQIKKFRKQNNTFLNICGTPLNDVINIQNNRRNSISSVYNEENMSFCIVIDNNCIITEENEEEKICYAELSEECLAKIHEGTINEEDLQSASEIILCPQEDNSRLVEPLEDSWVDDVACIETVVTDDIAEDIVISAPSSPRDYDESDSDESNIYTDHTEKVKYIYGGKMCHDDAEFVETLYRTPQMNVNKTLINRESLGSDDGIVYDEPPIGTDPPESHQEMVNQESEDDASEELAINVGTEISNNQTNTNNTTHEVIMPSAVSGQTHTETHNISNDSDIKTQDETVNSCESSIDDVFSNNQTEDSINCPASSSPEVSSTTSEEKSSTILLKITNYKGTITSQLTDVNLNRSQRKISCKFTENINYTNYHGNSTEPRPLITKAAQKYIPPPKETVGDLKIKLPLPQHSLMKFKQLKVSRNERLRNMLPKKDIQKKPKPRFEDVLQSIDEMHYKKQKEKNKKPKKSVPKVVIKKNENGSHYASTPHKESFNPDLTGRKWQPWVFLEKNIFIDKMALRRKTKAIYNHRKNTFVFADRFKKYKSIPSAKFIITQPNSDNPPAGQFKYTIRLKHSY